MYIFAFYMYWSMAAKKDSLNLKLPLYREKYHLKKLHDYLIDQQLQDSGFVKLHHNSDQGILQKVNPYQKKVHDTCPLNIYFKVLSNVLS